MLINNPTQGATIRAYSPYERSSTYKDFHTFTDFELILTSKDITAPVPKTNFLTIPARNGVIDLSSMPTQQIKYEQRTITLGFYSDKRVQSWSEEANRLWNELGGRKVKIKFDDDPWWYWEGRITDITPAYADKIETLTMTITVNPYRKTLETWGAYQEWLWDPFDFDQGIINETTNLTITSTGTLTTTVYCSQRWETPLIKLVSGSSATVSVTTPDNETNTVTVTSVDATPYYNLLFKAGNNTITISAAEGTVIDIYCQGGAL